MASSSGTSSGSYPSSLSPNSRGSPEEMQAIMDLRKRKRMQSNRESARRSRMRKRKHLDELMDQVSKLKAEKHHILTTLNITTNHYLALEAHNSVLRTQTMELTNRLHSLKEILNFINGTDHDSNRLFYDGPLMDDGFCNPWNMMHANQPIMASADMLQYC